MRVIREDTPTYTRNTPTYTTEKRRKNDGIEKYLWELMLIILGDLPTKRRKFLSFRRKSSYDDGKKERDRRYYLRHRVEILRKRKEYNDLLKWD